MISKDSGLGVAVWSTNLSLPVTSLQDWAEKVEAEMVAAKRDGASVFLMPEYASEQWLHIAEKKIWPVEQIGWMASQVKDALPLLSELSRKHDMLLVSGSFPCEAPSQTPPFTNRAHSFFPDGRIITQDKLCLTPKEKNPEGWNLSCGSSVASFMWQDFRIAVIICLDIELPALSAKLAQEDIDLILVPSMTKTLAGYHRVFDCAKARAVELQAAIGVCGAIGHGPARNPNISGCSFFLPCEEELGSTGVLASTEPVRKVEGAGPMLVKTLPLGLIRALRHGTSGATGSEVWPGAWTGEHVKVKKY